MKIFKKIASVIQGNMSNFPRGKGGCRAYAIGDIHGRLDLLDDLLNQVEQDIASRPRRKTFIVFLGDYIDRGPHSAGVIDRLRTFSLPHTRSIFLSGNHEEVLLRILHGDASVVSSWPKFGGAECAASYGLDPSVLAAIDEAEAAAKIRSAIPREHRSFLEELGDTFRFGDYLFVHAGIRPGVSIEDQDSADLRWIRQPFLGDAKEHGFVVVHGHTISREVDERPNRIGIDTGAYQSGVLTALAIEDDSRWYLSTGRHA